VVARARRNVFPSAPARARDLQRRSGSASASLCSILLPVVGLPPPLHGGGLRPQASAALLSRKPCCKVTRAQISELAYVVVRAVIGP
jgi:hypothetical protein